jgi:hypothetical protein
MTFIVRSASSRPGGAAASARAELVNQLSSTF